MGDILHSGTHIQWILVLELVGSMEPVSELSIRHRLTKVLAASMKNSTKQ